MHVHIHCPDHPILATLGYCHSLGSRKVAVRVLSGPSVRMPLTETSVAEAIDTLICIYIHVIIQGTRLHA